MTLMHKLTQQIERETRKLAMIYHSIRLARPNKTPD
jgi:hypothetical protein